MARFNVLVLPGVKKLGTSAVERLETYVRNGGGLVMTYSGEATSERLAELMGIRARLGTGWPCPESNSALGLLQGEQQ